MKRFPYATECIQTDNGPDACPADRIRFYDLRHTFATLALQNGVDIKTVSGMLGHYSVGFTLDAYAHITTSAQKEAANTMGNVLGVY